MRRRRVLLRRNTILSTAGHVQYAGRLSLEQQLHRVRQGHGRSGANRDYVIATVGALEELGYRETALHWLVERLTGAHETSATSS
jgi:cation transport protein ChaC